MVKCAFDPVPPNTIRKGSRHPGDMLSHKPSAESLRAWFCSVSGLVGWSPPPWRFSRRRILNSARRNQVEFGPPKSPEFGRVHEGFGQCWAKFRRILKFGRIQANHGLKRPKIGATRAKFNQNRPKLVESATQLAEIRQNAVEIAQLAKTAPTLVECRPNPGQSWSKPDPIGSNLGQLRQNLSLHPNAGQIWANLGKLTRNRVNLGRIRADLVEVGPLLD